MKDILRVYILGITTDTINLRLASDYVSSGTKDLLTRKKAAIESLGQSIPISEILKKIYISPNETKDSPEASQESVVKKIDGYTVNLMDGSNQVVLDATNLQKKIAPSSNGGYILYVTALDPTKIHPQADKIEEIQIVFDKNGSLITKTIDLVRSEKSSGSPIAHKQTYTISQS